MFLLKVSMKGKCLHDSDTVESHYNNNNNNDLLSEMENPKWKIFLEILFAQLIVGPAATEQRQVDVALSLSNVERQTG